MKLNTILSLLLLLFLTSNCKENSSEYESPTIDRQSYPSPYLEPSVSFDGKKIVFIRAKVLKINKDGYQNVFESDSTGIWSCNIDGSNLKLVYKNNSNIITNPQFFPNNEEVVFVRNGNICKAKLNNGSFNETDIKQLTTEGKNFFPSVSPDGKWITFDSNLGSPEGGYRVWKMKSNGDEKSLVIDGRMPFWSNELKWIYYIGFHREIFKVNTDNTSEVIQLTHLNEKDIYATYNFYPRCNRSGNLIAYSSKIDGEYVQIWLLSSTSNTIPLTASGINTNCSWSFDNRIVYINYSPFYFDKNNGTIWIMDSDGGNKKQITYNHGLILE